MLIPAHKLNEEQLDWAVELIERDGVHHTVQGSDDPVLLGVIHKFSTDWAQGGPIVERERIELTYPDDECRAAMFFRLIPVYSDGATPLVAAMRCYVTAKLGEEVEIPESM